MSGQVLGVDYGRARIGVALGNARLKIATPIEIIEHENNFEKVIVRLIELIEAECIELVVVGLPISNSGLDTQQTKEANSFIEALKIRIKIPIICEDERFTTRYANELRRGRGDTARDDMAAMLILQSYFDRI